MNYSDDFLSNGIYKLFSDFDVDDKFTFSDRGYIDENIPWNSYYNSCDSPIATAATSEITATVIGDAIMATNSTTLSNLTNNDKIMLAGQDFINLSNWQQSFPPEQLRHQLPPPVPQPQPQPPDILPNYIDDFTNFNNDDWELNIENLLLENGLDISQTVSSSSTTSSSSPTSSSSSSATLLTSLSPFHNLPDRTYFCNDSCNSFLRESSENLNSNLFNTVPSSDLYFEELTIPSEVIIPYYNNEKELYDLEQSYVLAPTPQALPPPPLLPPPPPLASPLISTLIQPSQVPPPDSTTSVGDEIQNKQPLTCPYESCQKLYAKPAHLKAHLRRHIGDKPYVCNWPNCTWRFSRSDELSRHRRSHSGVKPYKCDYCPKCFCRSDHLTKHRKVHERKLAKIRAAAATAAAAVSTATMVASRNEQNHNNMRQQYLKSNGSVGGGSGGSGRRSKKITKKISV